MLEKQRVREEAMKKKEADRQAEEQKRKAADNAAALAKVAPVSAAKKEAPAEPQDNNYKMKKDIYAPIPLPVRGKPTVFGGDPNGDEIIFCLNNDVIIRSLSNPKVADVYSEHSYATTVAKYSPDKKFVASGDTSGTIRVWHTEIIQGIVHKLKLEKKALGGAILDIAWDPESKRILAVGQGRDKYGVLFFAETGASAGEITGHSKTITTCDHRPTKPYRLITGGEDFLCNWFEGPPIKWKHSLKDFSNFVNGARFSPDGSKFAVVGQEKKGYVGDGDTGDVKFELGPDAHAGGIYSCSWSPDGSQILTVSGDKTAKIWDASNGKLVKTFTFGKELEDQQLGSLWQGSHLVSMNLLGYLSLLNPNNTSTPLRVIRGHNKSIEAMAYDSSTKTFYTGSYDTVISKWNEETAEVTPFHGKGHTNAIKQIAFQGGNLVTAAIDDTIRLTSLKTLEYSSNFIKLDGPPAGVAAGQKHQDLIVTATIHSIVVIRNGNIVSTTPVSYSPQAVALSIDEQQVAVGGEDNNIHLYTIQGDKVVEDGTLKGHRGVITKIRYSPDGKYLASSDRNREIIVWDKNKKDIAIKDWVYHTARVDALAWRSDSKYVASGALDQNVIVWSIENPSSRIVIKGAHHGGINEVEWLTNTVVASTGQDCTIRTWNVL